MLRKSEDNDGEIVGSLKQTGFELIPEDDEGSVIEDDLSDALNPDEKEVVTPAKPVLVSTPTTASIPEFKEGKPVIYTGAELVAKLGEYDDSPAVLEEPYKFCHAITDWEVLYNRYKPENIRKYTSLSKLL